MRLLFTALLCAAAGPALAIEPTAADAAALTALAAAADADWNEKDVAGMAAHYTADASLGTNGLPAPVTGAEAIRAVFTRGFAGRQAVERHVTEVERIEMITPDLALTEGAVVVERQEAAGWRPVRRFRNIALSARTPAGWKLRMVRATLLPSPAPAG